MSDEKIQNKPEAWANDRRHFYKYVSADVAKIILGNRTLRWTTPAQLNDPFDAQCDLPLELDLQKIKDLVRPQLWKVYRGELEPHPKNQVGALLKLLGRTAKFPSDVELFREYESSLDQGYELMFQHLPALQAGLSRALSTIKMLCLTVSADNALMWSHYAASHTGVVLRFRSIPELDSPFGMARPINYVAELPKLFSDELVAGTFAGTSVLDEDDIFRKATFTKSDIWAYEKEWRITSGSGRFPDQPFEDNPFGADELDGLIFGLRTSENDISELRGLAANYPNISIMRATRGRDSLLLLIEPEN